MTSYDVVIVGGGPAGLSAALVLGLARRRVAVFDAGKPRNAASRQAHGFLTRDGVSPSDLLQQARQQMAAYSSVDFHQKHVEVINRRDADFAIVAEDGHGMTARRVLFATGLVDDFPSIRGFREMWGISVLHCPYCHGWEVRDQPLAIYGNGEMGVELCVLTSGWSDDLALCSDGPAELSDEHRRLLTNNKVQIYEDRISHLEGNGGHLQCIVFEKGESLPRSAMFINSRQRQSSPLPAALGCELDPDGLIKADDFGQTTVAGAYVAGDIGRKGGHNITSAAYSGSRVAMAINRILLGEDFGLDLSPSCGQLAASAKNS